MNKTLYSKAPLSYEEQIAQLKERNLTIEHEERAIHLLEKLSYYRLSGYWHTLLAEPKTAHIFKEGSTFEQAFELYKFDRELRLLILNQIEKIEVSTRAIITYKCSHSWGAFWLSDKENFKSFSQYSSSINKIFGEIKRSKEIFLLEFQKKYAEELPPSWITLEVCSFGSLSWIYSIIKQGRTKRDIANEFGLNEKVFKTWLHTLVYIRNICAHHSRLWNKNLKITAEFPRNTMLNWIENTDITDVRTGEVKSIRNKSYYILCMIQYLLQKINPNNTFKNKLEELFEKYPLIDKNALGFTSNWRKEDLWS